MPGEQIIMPSLNPTAITKLSVNKKELNQVIPYFLKEREKGIVDPEWRQYINLYWQIKKINKSDSDLLSPEKSPLLQLKLIVSKEGLIEAHIADTLPLSYTRMEAYQVAKAIYQLAYSHAMNPKTDMIISLKSGIGFFLMRPFAKLYPTEEVLAILNLYRDLEFSFSRRLRTRDNYPTSDGMKNHSVILIQRLFRKNKHTRREIQIEEMSPELKGSMLTHHISLKPDVPSVYTPPSAEIKEYWLNSLRENQGLYRKVLHNLVYYRSHNKFMKQLLLCVKNFNNFLLSLPSDFHDYAIVVPTASSMYSEKSNHWVTALALPTLEKKPKAILFETEVDTFYAKNAQIKHLVFFDDAIYSGRQMHELMSRAEVQQAKYTLIVPFYNELGLGRAYDADHYILGERMLRADEMRSYYATDNTWQKEDSSNMNKVFSSDWNQATSKVGVFFQHKIADNASTFLADMEAIIHPIRNKELYRP